MNIQNAPSAAHDDYDITSRQVATNEASASARLDPDTEKRLYRLYREYFQHAETARNWNLWETIDWSGIVTSPSAELVAQVMAIWQDDSFLPDTMATLLHLLRASRGRAWFVTRWAYEEAKNLLALSEWLVRSGSHTQAELKAISESLLAANRWEPPVSGHQALLVDALLWELRQLERLRELRKQAEVEHDTALTSLSTYLLTDHEAHRDFFRSSLQIIAEKYPEPVRQAAIDVAQALEYPGGSRAILALIQA